MRSRFTENEKYPGKGPLTGWERDSSWQVYFRAAAKVKKEFPTTALAWPEADLELYRWQTAERLLRDTNAPDRLMECRLGYVGMSLADFGPTEYNNDQVARDSDGLQSLDKVA